MMSAEKLSVDYINREISENPYSFIEECEHDYNMSVCRVADKICRRNGHTIVMLAGPSSSGKTTTASMLAERLRIRGRDAVTVSLDDFYLSNDKMPLFEDGSPDYESVYSLDVPLIAECLGALDEKGECELPVFSFQKNGREKEGRYIRIDDDDIIVVEGLHALNPVITGSLPQADLLKLYISVSSRIYSEGQIVLTKRDIRFIRRMTRDYKHRNSSVENTFALWKGVRKGEDRYLFPYGCNADIRINTMHAYEPCVFKNVATKLLDGLDKSNPYFEKAVELEKKLCKFDSLSIESVPSTSLLMEFLG